MPSIGEYLAGAAFLTLVGGLCTGGALVAVRRLLPGVRGAPWALAVFLLASGALVFAHLLPAALGVLGRLAVAGCALLVALAAAATPRCRPSRPVELGEPPPGRASTGLTMTGILSAAGAGVAALAAYGTDAVTAVDATTVHLPQVVRYLQEGSIGSLVQYTTGFSNATYPQNGTMLLLASVLPWDSTFAVRFVNAPFLLAAATAVYACARELRAPASAAALAAAAVTALPAVNEPGFEQAQVDAPMLAWFAIGGLFLLRAGRSGSRAEIALAGVGLGLAFGAKWYAVVYVPFLVVLWAIARRGRGLPLLAASIAACGGAWLVRNWILTGNPVHPAPVRVLGATVFDAPPDPLRDFAGFTVSDYLFDADVLRHDLVPAWNGNFGLLGPMLVAAAVAAAIVSLRRRRDHPRAAAVAAAAVAMVMLYTIMPDTAFGPPGEPVLAGANARYLVPALLVAAVCAAWLAARHPRARLGIEALMLIGILEGIARSHGSLLPVIPVGAALVFGAVELARRRPRAAAAVAAVAVLGGGLIAARTVDPAEYGQAHAAIARMQASVPPGGRVALGGRWAPYRVSPVLPAFGPRLRNRVDYLGTFVGGTLQRHRDRGPFVRQLREGAYDAVVIGRGEPPRAGGELPEAAWAEAAGYRRAAASETLVVLLPEPARGAGSAAQPATTAMR